MPEPFNKVPEVALAFWIIKIAATTFGETGGDTVTTSLGWGYLASTGLFLAALVLLVSLLPQRAGSQPGQAEVVRK